jgi:hypothetical protein
MEVNMVKFTIQTFRCDKEDLRILREGAEKYGMNPSQWIRYLLRVGLMLNRPTIYKENRKERIEWD